MNKLFYGDNLDILRKPNIIPSGSVDLCYIDPPFNSKRNYNQIYNNIGTEDRAQAQAFMDTWVWDPYTEDCFNEILGNEAGRFTAQTVDLIRGLQLILGKGDLLAYLVSMTLRVNEIQRVLKPTGSFYLHCFPATTRVRLADGRYVPIVSVAPGDLVVTESGESGRVANCLHRAFKGDLVSLAISGVPEPLECTPEHQIFVLPKRIALRLRRMWERDGRHSRGVSPWKTRRARVDTDHYAAQVSKVAASQLERGDYCLLPIDRRIEASEALWLDVPRNEHHLATPLPTRVLLDMELAEICGLYLAEGGVSTQGYCVHWTFHERELETAQRLQQLLCRVFGVSSNIAALKGVKAIRLSVSSVALAAFFQQHFGCGSLRKILPVAVQRAPLEFQRTLFAAWARGDGYIRKGGYLRVTTISYNLALQMQQIALRLGAIATVGTGNRPHYRPQDNAQTAYRVQINAADAEKVGLSPVTVSDATRLRRAFILDDWLCLPVREVTRRPFDGEVFDLHLEPRHSYCAGGVKVSNCDPTASHYLKIVLDSVFIPRGGDYKNEIIWKRTNVHSDSKTWSKVSDTILFYTKSRDFVWNPPLEAHSDEYVNSKYRQQDENGRFYMLDNMTSPNPRPNMMYEWKGHESPPAGWRYSKSTMERLDAEGRIWYPDSKSKRPRLKRYLDEAKGTLVGNVWTDIFPLNSQAAERLGYPTQKPEALLERIILASSNEGDVVMDAYCGCGTTVAVAQRLGRQWIGLDITYQSIALILRRLEDAFGKAVADAVVLDGVPKDMKSAEALAVKKEDRTRKEFEKWALLTYSNNRAIVNEKKGADGGVDGLAYTRTSSDSNAKVVFQVKSGGVKSGDIDALVGVMSKVGAELAVFITLKEATAPMKGAAADAGTWEHPIMGKRYPRVRIVSIREMFDDNARLDLPLSIEVLKTAATAQRPSDQLCLDTGMSDDEVG